MSFERLRLDTKTMLLRNAHRKDLRDKVGIRMSIEIFGVDQQTAWLWLWWW